LTSIHTFDVFERCCPALDVRMQGMIKLYMNHDIDGFVNLVMHRQLAIAFISRNIEEQTFWFAIWYTYSNK